MAVIPAWLIKPLKLKLKILTLLTCWVLDLKINAMVDKGHAPKSLSIIIYGPNCMWSQMKMWVAIWVITTNKHVTNQKPKVCHMQRYSLLEKKPHCVTNVCSFISCTLHRYHISSKEVRVNHRHDFQKKKPPTPFISYMKERKKKRRRVQQRVTKWWALTNTRAHLIIIKSPVTVGGRSAFWLYPPLGTALTHQLFPTVLLTLLTAWISFVPSFFCFFLAPLFFRQLCPFLRITHRWRTRSDNWTAQLHLIWGKRLLG